jgi:branched-chain amino acid transport system ATP-binding protein
MTEAGNAANGAAALVSTQERPVLSVCGLSVSYGGVHALVGADLEVWPGQLVSLIGPNGAGKTTFVDAITGFVTYQGTVALDGQQLGGKSAHERARLGLARTWQSIELFDDLSVHENLSIAARRASAWTTLGEIFGRIKRSSPVIDDVLSVLGLSAFSGALPADLSHGQRKLVGIARALVSRPKVLCLDEPAAGLDTDESEELGRQLRTIVDTGTPVLLIDHDMGLVLGISDRVVVLEFGHVIASGLSDDVRRDPRVIAAYLGGAGELDSPTAADTVTGLGANGTGDL